MKVIRFLRNTLCYLLLFLLIYIFIKALWSAWSNNTSDHSDNNSSLTNSNVSNSSTAETNGSASDSSTAETNGSTSDSSTAEANNDIHKADGLYRVDIGGDDIYYRFYNGNVSIIALSGPDFYGDYMEIVANATTAKYTITGNIITFYDCNSNFKIFFSRFSAYEIALGKLTPIGRLGYFEDERLDELKKEEFIFRRVGD